MFITPKIELPPEPKVFYSGTTTYYDKALTFYASMPKKKRLISADTIILHNTRKEAEDWIADDKDFCQVKQVKLIIIK